MRTSIILYVRDQQHSRQVYRTLLARDPALDVPGMTEFDLGGCTLGLMPEDGIARIITPPLPHPAQGHGLPRCELYLFVPELEPLLHRAALADLTLVDEAKDRDWGHRAAYFADADGHVIALAGPMRP